MAQCKYCDKKGFFLTVSKDGLCKNCAPSVLMVVNQLVRIIQESNEIVEKTKNFKTKMGRMDTIVRNLETLDQDYYSKGIEAVSSNPKTLIQEVEKNRITAIEEEVSKQVEKSMDRARIAKTVATKINNANKALLILKEFNDDYGYINQGLFSDITTFIHQSEYDDLLLKAEKEEFKGNNKKAIDRYQDVLFFLKKDDIDDQLQVGEITEIENRINKLSS